jgi:uncharacterized repeat protein (TIGR02543 family)
VGDEITIADVPEEGFPIELPIDETAYHMGETVTVADAPEAPAGYIFDGWYLDDEIVTEFTMPADNVTLVVKWDYVHYSFTYTVYGNIPDDYETPANRTDAHVGEVIDLTDLPYKEGYAFGGWAYNNKLVKELVMPAGDVNVVGIWRTSNVSSVDPTEPVDPTNPVYPTEEPTEPVDPTEEPTEPVDPTEEPTEPVDPTNPVYPTEEPTDEPVETFTVTYSGADYVPEAAIVEAGTEYVISDDRAISSGKIFKGWLAGSEEYAAGDRFIVTEDVTLVADWYRPATNPTGATVVELNNILHTENPDDYPAYDMNGDGHVNIIDLVLMAQYVADSVAVEA